MNKLGQRQRQAVLALLAEDPRERTPNEISDATGVPVGTLGGILRELRDAGIAVSRPRGRGRTLLWWIPPDVAKRVQGTAKLRDCA